MKIIEITNLPQNKAVVLFVKIASLIAASISWEVISSSFKYLS